MSHEDIISIKHKAFQSPQVDSVMEYMKDHEPNAPKWMIETQVSVNIDTLQVNYIIHFNYDKSVIIYSSGSSGIRAGDQMAIRALVSKLIEFGWDRAHPSPSEIDSAREFWKELWVTGVVDSNYLQSRYGKRKIFDEEL